MAEITVKGYANRVQRRTSGKGDYYTFTLAERQKAKDGTYYKVFYDVVDFKSAEGELPEGAFLTLSGWFTMSPWSKGDKSGTNYSINAQKIEIAPPRDAAPTPAEAAPPSDPFALSK